MTTRSAHHTTWLLFLFGALATCGHFAHGMDGDRNKVAILKDPAIGTTEATVEAVADALRRAAFDIEYLSSAAACDPTSLSARRYSLFVIPNAKKYPEAGGETLARFLHNRGNLMVIGSNPFSDGPLIETLSPGYKTYAMSDVASLEVESAPAILPDAPVAVPSTSATWSCYARPQGKGFERGYKWRWIPLIRAYGKDGVRRGTAAWMLLNQAPLSEGPAFEDAVARLAGTNVVSHLPPAAGSVLAVCAISDDTALRDLARTSLLGDMAGRIRDGLFLSRAGSEQFSYWPGEKIRLGAVAVNGGSRRANLGIRVRVSDGDGGNVVFEKSSDVTIEAGGTATATFEWAPDRLIARRYVARTELLRDGKPIDAIAHEIGILPDERASRDGFITVRDGDFWLEGKKWHPVGVNYWPRHAIALECEDYVFHWLTPGFYDPEEVDRDLGQLESMGANFVSIRAHHQNDRRTVLDFLRRCRNHGIRVMVFVQTHVITDDPHYFQGLMMPFHFQEREVTEFIRSTRLADNPTLMAWDLIWEPAGWAFGGRLNSFGWKDPAPYRQRWDADWARWITERYGSLANAEADWGVPAPRLGDKVTSPVDKQFREDGPARIMVAAYRRFMDNLMSRKWNDATRKLRALDPNHLVSFRQGNLPPIDFTLTATPKHIDFFSMEGYGIQPDAAGSDQAGFINRYIRFVTGGKPHIWAEFGASAWDRASMRATEPKTALQGRTHEVIYRMALKAGASGASPWWLAGGYRVSEKSDFGILNPDGTLRPSGDLLRQYAALFKNPRPCPESDDWFTMDRDAHAGSHWYYATHDGAEAYGRAAMQGRMLGVRTPGTGTTSANTPLIAVGNRPCNGHNPPKYLDAEFNWFRVKANGRDWIEVGDGARIRVPGGKPIRAVASVGNLQEATWLTAANCGGKPGAVYLATTVDSGLKLKAPIARDTAWMHDADFGESFLLTEGITTETRIEMQMTAEGRASFGEKLRFTLLPEDSGK